MQDAYATFDHDAVTPLVQLDPQTFVLETTWQTPTGRARVTDFLPPSTAQGDLVRRVECVEGEVTDELLDAARQAAEAALSNPIIEDVVGVYDADTVR